MIQIPAALGCVASFADRKASGSRWSMIGVQVEDKGEGKYAVAATDTKILIAIEGHTKHDPTDHPMHAKISEKPNTATTALIPAALFGQTLKDASKAGKKKRYKPILNTVLLQLGKEEASLAYSNLDQESMPTTRLIDGRFPPFRDILPTRRPKLAIPIDPEFLMTIAKAVADLKSIMGTGDQAVTIGYYGPDKPVMVEVRPDEGSGVDSARMLVMPLNTDNAVQFDGFKFAYEADEGFWEKQAVVEKERAEHLDRMNDELREQLHAKKKIIDGYVRRVTKAKMTGTLDPLNETEEATA